MNDALHQELEALMPSNVKRCLIHALIDLGIITKLECMWDDCICETRKFSCHEGRAHPLMLTIDHIVERCEGGDDRPSNLRIMHHRCNSALGSRNAIIRTPHKERKLPRGDEHWTRKPENREKMLAVMKANNSHARKALAS